MGLPNLFSLQGKMYSAIRNGTTGLPGAMSFLGNVSKAEFSLTPTISDKFETQTGRRLLLARLMKQVSAELDITFDEINPETLALALWSSSTAITGTTVTNEALPTALVAGNTVKLAHNLVSAVSVIDSTGGTPLTVPTGDYTLDLGSGVITFTTVGTFMQPFKVSYTYANSQQIKMLTATTPPERYIYFDGVDSYSGDSCTVRLYRCQFLPASGFGLIDDDWGGFELKAGILYDSVNEANGNGPFGDMTTNIGLTA